MRRLSSSSCAVGSTSASSAAYSSCCAASGLLPQLLKQQRLSSGAPSTVAQSADKLETAPAPRNLRHSLTRSTDGETAEGAQQQRSEPCAERTTLKSAARPNPTLRRRGEAKRAPRAACKWAALEGVAVSVGKSSSHASPRQPSCSHCTLRLPPPQLEPPTHSASIPRRARPWPARMMASIFASPSSPSTTCTRDAASRRAAGAGVAASAAAGGFGLLPRAGGPRGHTKSSALTACARARSSGVGDWPSSSATSRSSPCLRAHWTAIGRKPRFERRSAAERSSDLHCSAASST
mmetsp:Transcript_27850/g.89418  ORF Transcript_27850/g.89418 Transcript_27850/m.89418 type:complete len:293 (-) Transcript_27850:147-1025(-)